MIASLNYTHSGVPSVSDSVIGHTENPSVRPKASSPFAPARRTVRFEASRDTEDPHHAESVGWPALWVRCRSRIRTWRVPPRWSQHDWNDEVRALADAVAHFSLREFDPSHSVPLDAFLYRKVIEAVWTRYRQECGFGRRSRSGDSLPERAARESHEVDSETTAIIENAMLNLNECDRHLIRQIFWHGRREDELAQEMSVTRQAINSRKQRILYALRSKMKTKQVMSKSNSYDFSSSAVAESNESASFIM